MNDKQYLLEEGKNGNILCSKNEKELINHLFAYIVKYHSESPPPSEVIEVCKAALELFPYLRVNPSGIEGIVRVFFFNLDRIIRYSMNLFFRICFTILRQNRVPFFTKLRMRGRDQ